jgi:alpha-glucosidase (family GH31 glycosyl hydrolase)
MRALPLEFSSDPASHAVSDQFLFGSALLVNPVTTEGATQRTVYLPTGSNWIDFWTGKRMTGGQSITADCSAG